MEKDNLPAAAASPQPCARDIDALVAEKVMGWKKDPVHPNLRGDGWWEDEPGSYTCELLEFSTDPTASKQLRDKMRADGWQWKTTAEGSRFLTIFWKGEEGEVNGLQEAETEETAVARAALMAVGVDLQGGPDGTSPQAAPKGLE